MVAILSLPQQYLLCRTSYVKVLLPSGNKMKQVIFPAKINGPMGAHSINIIHDDFLSAAFQKDDDKPLFLPFIRSFQGILLI
jgi:hypothetical protein